MNDDIRFDSGRSAAWKNAIVEAARADRAGRNSTRKRVALIVGLVIAALLVSGGGVAYALSAHLLTPATAPMVHTASPEVRDTAPPSVTPAPTPTPTPTPTETSAPSTADYTVLGFDAVQLRDLCQEAVRTQYASWEQTSPGVTEFAPLTPDTLRDAQEDGAGHVAIFASSVGNNEGGQPQVWICEFKGDPTNPELIYASFPDR
jgi:hypothetical protein